MWIIPLMIAMLTPGQAKTNKLINISTYLHTRSR